VHSASLASIVPFGGVHHGALVQHAGTAPAPPGEREPGVSATYMIVGSDYFETVRVPILRGRAFSASEEDSPGAPPVAVIDEVLATQLFGGDDPIGRQIQLRHEKDADVMTVIGVTSGFRQDLFDRTLRPHVFVPYGRNYRAAVHIHVRLANPTAAAETQMLQTVRREIRAADDRVPVIALKTLRQHRDEGISLWAVSTGARLFAMFGAVALLLAVVGVYGLKSYVVSRRTREMGIRMALGATPRDVVWLVVHEGLWLTSAGLALGILAAVGLGRIVGGLVYEVNPLDPLVFAVAPALLTVSALLASYLPARRAAHIVPTRALRHE
jgi:predicted permease